MKRPRGEAAVRGAVARVCAIQRVVARLPSQVLCYSQLDGGRASTCKSWALHSRNTRGGNLSLSSSHTVMLN